MLTYSILSETGGRDENEDCVGVYEKNGRQVFLLADGLGGHGHGAEASHLAVQMGELLLAEDFTPEEYLQQLFLHAHEELKKLQRENRMELSMRTTLTAVLIEDGQIWRAHIGDSRIYLFQDGKVVNRTMDHSVPQMLVLSGEIKEREIRRHPDRNRLLRCLGDSVEIPKFEIAKPIEAGEGMALLLCSDGFWEPITERRMESGLKWSRDVDDWLSYMKRKMKRAEKKNPDQDNYSAVGIWIMPES